MDEQAIIKVESGIKLGVLAIDTPRDMVARASEIATELAKVVSGQKLYSIIQGRKFVHVEGWETLGAMLGIVAREVAGSVIEHDNGDFEASVELIRVSDGAIIGYGSALCGCDEVDRNGKQTWGSRARYARRSMAVTRAAGKAFRLSLSWIMKLAGYEPTPAEEMQDQGPQWTITESASSTPQSGATSEPQKPTSEPTPAQPELVSGNVKNAALRYQPFVTWCNEWVKDARAAKYAKEHGGANMYHILARVAKLGYTEVTEGNVEEIKVELQKHVGATQ